MTFFLSGDTGSQGSTPGRGPNPQASLVPSVNREGQKSKGSEPVRLVHSGRPAGAESEAERWRVALEGSPR